MRNVVRLFACAALFLVIARPASGASCEDWGGGWLTQGCDRLVDTYENGQKGVLISGYSWHLPGTWTAERRAELNSNAWGGGVIRTTEDEKGDSRSVYFMVFEDSHRHAQFQVGYEHSTYWGPRSGLQPGLGYTVAIVQRPDIASGIPFPVVLPIASLRYGQGTLYAIYIPTLNGGINHGSTLFLFGRILLK